MINQKLLNVMACPICKQALSYYNDLDELVCHKDKLVFAVRNGIPCMLLEEAQELNINSDRT
jgi:uncharacterized protein